MSKLSNSISQSKNNLQNVKKGNMNDINNFINNVSQQNFYIKLLNIFLQKDEYYTQIYYQKSYNKGHETIKGAFYAINKNKVPEPPKNIDQSYYYTNNNKPEYYINDNKQSNYNFFSNKNNNYNNGNYYQCKNNYGNNSNNYFFQKVILIMFCFLIAFLIYDFLTIYKNVKKDNNIERNRCINEYKESKCDRVTSDDGPIANDFCMEKLKCIHEHTVYFHVVLIKYIRSIITNSIRGSNLINISLFAITIIIIFKLLY